jgi:hypothetical protein
MANNNPQLCKATETPEAEEGPKVKLNCAGKSLISRRLVIRAFHSIFGSLVYLSWRYRTFECR